MLILQKKSTNQDELLLQESDRGSYVCTAVNQAGRDSQEVILRVQGMRSKNAVRLVLNLRKEEAFRPTTTQKFCSLISISVAPRFLVMPEDQEVTSNGRIDLECAAEGTPTPRITWKVNNTAHPSECATYALFVFQKEHTKAYIKVTSAHGCVLPHLQASGHCEYFFTVSDGRSGVLLFVVLFFCVASKKTL